MTKNKWSSASELMETIRDATDRLVSGETSVDEAHAEARLLGTAGKVIGLQLDHARLTGRLQQGSDVLPDFRFGDSK